MDIRAIKEEWAGWSFDQIDFEVDADSIVAFAKAVGETQPRFIDPAHPDFQAVPNFTTKFHGRRQLPEGFPMVMEKSFDAGKAVEALHPIRAGDTISADSTIHDIFEKTGRSGGMMFVVHRMRFTNQDGTPVSVVDWKMLQKLG